MPEKVNNLEKGSVIANIPTVGLIPELIGENQGQVSQVLGKGNSSQFTPEGKSQIENFLSSGKFDAEDFLQLPNKLLGKYLILRVIDQNGLAIAQNLVIFDELDEEIALKLIEAGEGWTVGKNIKRFNCPDYSKIVLKLLDEGEEESFFDKKVMPYSDSCLNKYVALKLIEKGYEEMIIDNLELFQGLDSEIFFDLGGEGYPHLLERIFHFDLSNIEIEKIIENISDIVLLTSLYNGLIEGGLDSCTENSLIDRICKRILGLIDEDPSNLEWSLFIVMILCDNGYGSQFLERIDIGCNMEQSFFDYIDGEKEDLLKKLGSLTIESFLNILNEFPKLQKLVQCGDHDLLMRISGSSSIEELLSKLIQLPDLFDKVVTKSLSGDESTIINGELLLKYLGNPSIESFLDKGIELPESFMEIMGRIPKIELPSIAPRIIKNDLSIFDEFSETNFNGMKLYQHIYPSRDYSPNGIYDYSDKSQHLKRYTYNLEGYTFTLSNLLGYKLKEGMQADIALLEGYKVRVQNITQISKDTNSLSLAITALAQENDISLESTGLELQILEYLLKKQEHIGGITKNDFDLLIAYQLMGRFEQFVRNSNDKLATSTDVETIHMTQVLALLQEYGDPLKESIRKLERCALQKGANGENTHEVTFLLSQFRRKIPKEVSDLTKDRILGSIMRSFSQRPEYAITDTLIQKSILEKCISVLQRTDIALKDQEAFAKSFEIQDFLGLSDINRQEEFISKWKQQVVVHFGSLDALGFDLRSIAKVQQSIYSSLQQETLKFEEITDKNGLQSERHVFARFGKNRYDSLARGVGDICLGNNSGMWKNPEYFELVLFDIDRLKCIGTVMLLNMTEPDGKKYLLYGPNPSVEFDDKVSSSKLFKELSRIVIKFAEDNNFDGVVFDPAIGRSTNRSGEFQNALEQSQLKEDNGKIKKINLKKDHLLGSGYVYRNNLSFLYMKS